MTRIGISTRGLNQGSFAISTIIYHLTRNIVELAPEDIELFLYFNDPENEKLFDKGTKKRSIRMPNRFAWDHFWLPTQLKKDKIDIAMFFKGTMSFWLPCQGAVLFHDLGYFHNKLRPYRLLETIYMKIMMARAGRKAFRIFSISDHTGKETNRILGVNPLNIRTVYPDCSPDFKIIRDQGLLDKIRTVYELPEKFIFWPTSLSPRKNSDRVLDAFASLLDKIPHQLVITGGKAWKTKTVLKRIFSEFPGRINLLGNIPRDHMAALYNLADFTIYPSLLEGFGFPILESFRCGRAILTSNVTSMPEIAGEAAYLVNPYSMEEIATGIYSLATDKTLKQTLEKKGMERANLFSWKNAAERILAGLLELR